MKAEGYTMVVHVVLLVATLVHCGEAISPHFLSHAVVDASHRKQGKVLHNKAADLEKTVLRLFSTNKHAGPLSDLVDSIVPFLDNMEEEINASHHAAQAGLNASFAGFDACTTAKIHAEGNASELLHVKNDLSTSHRSCRSQEEDTKDDLDSCDAVLHSLEVSKNVSCEAYHGALRTPNINLVPAPVEETYMEWIERVYVWVVAERNSIQAKRDQCNNETSAYSIKKSECQGAGGDGGFKKVHEDMKLICDNNQSALESQTCSYAHKVQGTCDWYNVCYNTTNTSLSAQLGDIQAAESSRQSEWWIVQRIRCYFQVFVAAGDSTVDSARIEACKNVDHNTSHMTLIYPSVVYVPAECESVLTPCGTDYISSEYGLLPSKAPAKECTPCTSQVPGGGSGSGQAPLLFEGAGCNGRATNPDVGSADLNFASTEAFSVEARVRANAADQNTGLVSRGTGDLRGWSVFIHPGNGGSYLLLYLFASNGGRLEVGTTQSGPDSFTFGANQWYDIRVTYDGSETAAGVHMFVDGTERAVEVKHNNNQIEQQPNTYDITSSGSLTICGFFQGLHGSFNGEIQDVKIHGQASAPTNAPAPPTPAPGPPADPIIVDLHCAPAEGISYPERSSVILHLDAAQLNSFELDSSATSADNNMYRWRDISGVSPQLYAVGYSAQPSVKCNSPKGQAVVQQSRQPMQIRDESGAAKIRPGITASTVFMVLKARDGYSWYWCFGQAGFYGVHQGWGLLQRSGPVKEYIGYADGSFPDGQKDTWNIVRPNYVSGGDYWFTVAWTIGPEKNVLYVDGEKYKEHDNGRGEIGQPVQGTPQYSWTVGARYDMIEAADQEVAELVVYDKQLSETDILSLSGALRSKWIS